MSIYISNTNFKSIAIALILSLLVLSLPLLSVHGQQDQTAPTIVEVVTVPDPPLMYLETAEILVEVTDDTGVTQVTVEWDGSDPLDMIYDEASGLWKHIISGQIGGTNYSVTVTAYDAAGNSATSIFDLWWLPYIVLKPDEGISAITIEGFNFNASSTINVYWDDEWIPIVPFNVTTDESGTFTCIISAFNQTVPGPHNVTVEDADDTPP